MITKEHYYDNYDQASYAVADFDEPELRAEIMSIQTVSLEALQSVLSPDDVRAARRIQAIMNLAAKHRMEYAQ